ncbi:DUF1007 family protein [Citrobacter sp. JGM124]|uniref:DUF1007 family protein n=1 Tax=Citrobacter sp. JGM124 TaxID=2799789 RepID=UPI001BA8140D|nr:DUF1007 family protein [Citrobacter sp. JGM124]MBS0849051.1 DUF1007 family protein [Citrobacter sp. JGM124]
MNDKRGLIIGFILLMSGLVSFPAQAHPHSFISLKTTPVIDQGRFTGLKMQWLMDDLTSADLLYDAGDAAPDSPVWKKLAAEVMANVLAQHYFTEVWHQGNKVKFTSNPPEYRLERVGNQAMLSFVLPLARPLALEGTRFTFSTFDPSFYVDMKYDHDTDAFLPPSLAPRCQISVATPEPSEEMLLYAAALDKEDAPPEDMALGQQFAQQVTLQCQ